MCDKREVVSRTLDVHCETSPVVFMSGGGIGFDFVALLKSSAKSSKVVPCPRCHEKE